MTAHERVQSLLDTLRLNCIPAPDVDPASWEKWLDSFAMPPRFCPECREVLVLRQGPYGEFYGCSAYPRCDYSEAV